MKSSMKKLAVFVMIAAIAIFIAAATASAWDRDRDDHQKGIIGEYGFTGGGICISTPFVNYAPTIPKPFNLTDPTKVSASSFHAHGILTFKKDGTGNIDLHTVGTTLYTPANPPTTPPTILPSFGASYAHVTYPFTYTLGADGAMNWAAVLDKVKLEILNPLTGLPTGMIFYRDYYSLAGWVSADHKTIVLATPAPEVDTQFDSNMNAVSSLICHESHTLTLLDE